MPCYHPLSGYRSRKGGLTFRKSESIGQAMHVPCGQCIGCRLLKSQTWATRIVHEAQMHPENCFLTLTYRPEDLPDYGSLKKEHVQKFLKRLRKDLTPKKIRYYYCGEYGEKLSRPHYHLCLFNHEFPDKIRHRYDQKTGWQYISQHLTKLWPYGFHEIGTLNYASAGYAARYCLKKINGQRAATHYEYVDPDTGEIQHLQAEYTDMSRGRKPGQGIGGPWYAKYHKDAFPSDYLINNGTHIPVPQYYRDQLKKDHPILAEKLRKKRIKTARKHAKDNTPERLETREQCKIAQTTRLTRNYENDS